MWNVATRSVETWHYLNGCKLFLGFLRVIHMPHEGLGKVVYYCSFSRWQVIKCPLLISRAVRSVLPHVSLPWLPAFLLARHVWLVDQKFRFQKFLGASEAVSGWGVLSGSLSFWIKQMFSKKPVVCPFKPTRNSRRTPLYLRPTTVYILGECERLVQCISGDVNSRNRLNKVAISFEYTPEATTFAKQSSWSTTRHWYF